jgi:hypothetical protein
MVVDSTFLAGFYVGKAAPQEATKKCLVWHKKSDSVLTWVFSPVGRKTRQRPQSVMDSSVRRLTCATSPDSLGVSLERKASAVGERQTVENIEHWKRTPAASAR